MKQEEWQNEPAFGEIGDAGLRRHPLPADKEEAPGGHRQAGQEVGRGDDGRGGRGFQQNDKRRKRRWK